MPGGFRALDAAQDGAGGSACRLDGSGYGGHPCPKCEREEGAEGVEVGGTVVPMNEHFHSFPLVFVRVRWYNMGTGSRPLEPFGHP